MNYLLRRRKLGATSCREIANITEQKIEVRRNDGPLPKAEVVIRWGCTSHVDANIIINKVEAIHLVNDKKRFRKLLSERAPETIPTTYFNPNDLQYPLRAPVVVRRSPHAQGRFLHLCKNEAAVRASCALYEDFYISDYIKKVEEYRITFISGRVVWIAKKTPANPEDVAWNVARGGRFDNVKWGDWPLKSIEVAYKAYMLSGLDFGAVDIMVDEAGRSYVLEINSAPSLTSPYRQSCMAKGFMYILDNGNHHIPIINTDNYKNCIHPSLLGER